MRDVGAEAVYSLLMLFLRHIRKSMGYTASDLADVIGTTMASMGRKEMETQPIKLDELRKIAAFLGVTVAQLIGEIPWPADTAQSAAPAVPLLLVRLVAEAFEAYLVEEDIDLPPQKKAAALELLLEFALDNPDWAASGGVDMHRVRSLIRAARA